MEIKELKQHCEKVIDICSPGTSFHKQYIQRYEEHALVLYIIEENEELKANQVIYSKKLDNILETLTIRQKKVPSIEIKGKSADFAVIDEYEAIKLDYNIQNPKTEIEHIYLALLLWEDIYRNNYICKSESKYFHYVKNIFLNCPLCVYYSLCEYCFLSNIACNTDFPNYLGKWKDSSLREPWESPQQYSYMIYKQIETKFIKLGGIV